MNNEEFAYRLNGKVREFCEKSTKMNGFKLNDLSKSNLQFILQSIRDIIVEDCNSIGSCSIPYVGNVYVGNRNKVSISVRGKISREKKSIPDDVFEKVFRSGLGNVYNRLRREGYSRMDLNTSQQIRLYKDFWLKLPKEKLGKLYCDTDIGSGYIWMKDFVEIYADCFGELVVYSKKWMDKTSNGRKRYMQALWTIFQNDSSTFYDLFNIEEEGKGSEDWYMRSINVRCEEAKRISKK